MTAIPNCKDGRYLRCPLPIKGQQGSPPCTKGRIPPHKSWKHPQQKQPKPLLCSFHVQLGEIPPLNGRHHPPSLTTTEYLLVAPPVKATYLHMTSSPHSVRMATLTFRILVCQLEIRRTGCSPPPPTLDVQPLQWQVATITCEKNNSTDC